MSAKRYNSAKIKWSFVDFLSLEGMVKVLEFGCHKYTVYEDFEGNRILGKDFPIEDAHKYTVIESGADNWKNGLSVREICESLLRHTFALMAGEDNDPESGLPHEDHIGCNYMFLSYMRKFKPEFDDRSNKKPKCDPASRVCCGNWNDEGVCRLDEMKNGDHLDF